MRPNTSLTPSLLFVVALAAEARPLLTHYGLKRISDEGFTIYASESTYLVVSGMGKINAAAATAHALSRIPQIACTVNIGIGGSDNPLGTLFRANCITNGNPSKRQSLYPPQIFKQNLPGISVSSVDQANTAYKSSEVFDMEAHAFCTTARRYLSAELVQSLKVISDNPQTPLIQTNGDKHTIKVNKQFVTDLIEQKMPQISSYAAELIELSHTLPANSQAHTPSAVTQYFMEKLHFTESERKLLQGVINRYVVLKQTIPYSNQISSKEGQAKPALSVKPEQLPRNASALLKELEKTLQQHYPCYIENQ